MSKLWSKHTKNTLHPVVEKFTAGSDYIYDMHLMPFDIEASAAHAKALVSAGVLKKSECVKIEKSLKQLLVRVAAGKIKITPKDEDCHTVIEQYLVSKLGDIGKKIHTGRSRNDQVLTAIRLYMRSEFLAVRNACLSLAEVFTSRAQKYARIPMPGYSHTQQAMLSSVGHYFASFAESLLDDESLLAALSQHADKNPLGSAAGFGTAIPLNRLLTTKSLGFAAVQINSLYAQASRGKFESMALEGLSQVSATLSRFANDMILFTSQEFGYFSADDRVVTGSSIMPHKKNLDPLELVRASHAVLLGNQVMIKEISKNLLSGYNRDLQLIKKPLIESFSLTREILEVVSVVLAHLEPNEKTIRAKIHDGMFTADIANDLVMTKNLPFRDAYIEAASMATKNQDLSKNLTSKKTLGAPGNLSLASYTKRIRAQRRLLKK